MEVTYVPDFDDEGRVRGLFTLVNDMSDRIQAEEQLRQAQKMEAVGKLTGGVAHDFNNLLAVILGNAELLREKLGEDDPAIEAVTRASRRGAELTQRLLSFSRQLPLQPAAVGLADLVSDMAGMLRRTLGATIAIETRSGKDLWQAHADPGQLENAILNIAINAQHAMPDGGALRIEIDNTTIDEETADRLDDAIPGEFVVLSITDTGHGIPPDALPRVFEPFFTTKEVGEGSGLGLSMVYGFVRQSGGFVAIESIEGQGTKVRLYLPRAVAGKPAEERPPDTAGSESNGETILVVEDDRDVRAMTVTLLESLGYKVFWAEDGESAHSVLQREDHIDLLLSDVVLPGDVSGPKIAEAALRRRPELKVLFMSGYAEDVVRRQASGSASDIDLLPKPFRRGDLARKVRETIERGAAGTA
jgi:nitrogen-specific signal transduction histidine kinase/CheY-like chemotaxis protein